MKDSSAITNSVIQVFGIVGVQVYGLEWAIYPAMFMVLIVVCMQTIAAGYVFSIGAYQDKTDQPGHTVMLSVLVSLMYAMTSYQIYLSGFEVCAGIALAHAMIMFLTHIFKLIIPKKIDFYTKLI